MSEMKKVPRPSMRRKAANKTTFTANDRAAVVTVRLDKDGNITGQWFERNFTRASAKTYCDDYYESMRTSKGWHGLDKAPETEEGVLIYNIAHVTRPETLIVVIVPTAATYNDLLATATKVIYGGNKKAVA